MVQSPIFVVTLSCHPEGGPRRKHPAFAAPKRSPEGSAFLFPFAGGFSSRLRAWVSSLRHRSCAGRNATAASSGSFAHRCNGAYNLCTMHIVRAVIAPILEFGATVLIWILIERVISTRVAILALCFCLVGIVYLNWGEIKSLIASPSNAIKYPLPKGPGIRVESNTPVASQLMCVGLSDEQQTQCFCPRPLAYELKALAPPTDNNYATEITITQPPEQFQRIRVFLRTMISSAIFEEVVPDDKTAKSITMLGTLTYDKFSFVIQSTAPKISYKVAVSSSEQLRLRCINYEN
jgi:hypothetical protein